MKGLLTPTLTLFAFAAAACGTEVARTDAPTPAGSVASAPLAGVDGSTDSADTRCNVVLRTMNRRPNDQGGYVTDAQYRWIWFADIDVSAAAVAEGAVPALLYQVGSEPTWYSVDATLLSTGAAYSRYEATPALIGEGISGSSLSNVHVRAIPYLRMAGGGRLFDHNRITNPVASYDLSWGQGGLAIADDPNVCPPPSALSAAGTATISFALDGNVTQSGALIGGNKLIVRYALDRLPRCRATHNGFPAWGLVAHARFSPSGATADGQVRDFITNYGVPTNQAVPVPFVTDIPRGTRSVELWFENSSGAGNFCTDWDSRNGQNYVFSVLQPPGWMGEVQVVFSRSGPGCDGGAPIGDHFTFDTWVRQRAVARNVCFQVWQAGTTDRANPDLWRQLDVEAHYRFSPTAPFRSVFVSALDRVGNNARYAFDVNSVDPFRQGACEHVPMSRTADGQYDEARMELFFTANGAILSAGNDRAFTGLFDDYAGQFALRCP